MFKWWVWLLDKTREIANWCGHKKWWVSILLTPVTWLVSPFVLGKFIDEQSKSEGSRWFVRILTWLTVYPILVATFPLMWIACIITTQLKGNWDDGVPETAEDDAPVGGRHVTCDDYYHPVNRLNRLDDFPLEKGGK